MPATQAHEGAGEDRSAALYQPTPCTVELVEDLTPTERLFRLRRDDGQPFGHQPGQFVQVSMLGVGEAPISVSSSPTRGPHLDLGIRRAGELTGLMHAALKPGDSVGVRGPFGTCFDVDAMRGQDLVLIAGGCGLAPMRALIQYCEDRREDFGNVTVLYGARSPQDLLYKEDLEAWIRSPQLDCRSTVDEVPPAQEWQGNVGVITTLIPPLEIAPDRTIAVIVGPPVMYRFVISHLKDKGIAHEHMIVSLERHMKCGVGKCGHCTIEHLYCCLDGPVFRLDEVIGLRGAI
ncbi:MAG: FAD/NAD(P)-binding protein [Armatimonadota bacterium]|nr:FAD/NAD(P)-binding protein [Armatimonadota bacterium]